jgi:energy-coupling factor transporter transmembrane protein EcfT
MNHLYESNRYLLHSLFGPYSIVIFFLLLTLIVFIPRNFYFLFIIIFCYFTMQFQWNMFYTVELHDRMPMNGH